MSDQNEIGYVDYFSPFVGFGTYTLPDGLQTITFKIMNEGDRMRYQQKTNRPININRKDDTASIRPDIAQDRMELITSSVTDWTLQTKRAEDGAFVPVVFSQTNLKNWVQVANPKIISALEKEIQKANPWMQGELSISDIKEEIANLEELLERRVREESEKNS